MVGFFFFNRGETEMKKEHRAVQKGPNKWEKKTSWRMEAEDFVCLGILLIIAGYVAVRALIG